MIVHDSRRSRLVLGVLVVAALLFMTVDYRDGSSPVMSGMRTVSSAVFGGAENLASSVTGLGRGGSGGSSRQVRALTRQVIALRAALSREQLSKSDYAQLRRLLSLSGRGGYRVVAATVIAAGQGYQQTVTLDAGRSDGVRARETVLNGQGLVGEVTAVSADTCTVLLATDSSSTVGVQLAPSGRVGWVTGQGKTSSGTGRFRLQILDGSAALRVGQQLVTSASVRDRPYVAGVPVGVISAVLNKAGALTARAQVRPYVDFTDLGVVGIVITAPDHDPRFSVLPPQPRARPMPTVTVTVTPGAPSPGAGTAPSAGLASASPSAARPSVASPPASPASGG